MYFNVKCLPENKYDVPETPPRCLAENFCPEPPGKPLNSSRIVHNFVDGKTYKTWATGNNESVFMNCSTKEFQIFRETNGMNLGDELNNTCNWDTEFRYTKQFVEDLECKSK